MWVPPYQPLVVALILISIGVSRPDFKRASKTGSLTFCEDFLKITMNPNFDELIESQAGIGCSRSVLQKATICTGNRMIWRAITD